MEHVVCTKKLDQEQMAFKCRYCLEIDHLPISFPENVFKDALSKTSIKKHKIIKKAHSLPSWNKAKLKDQLIKSKVEKEGH